MWSKASSEQLVVVEHPGWTAPRLEFQEEIHGLVPAGAGLRILHIVLLDHQSQEERQREIVAQQNWPAVCHLMHGYVHCCLLDIAKLVLQCHS